MTEVIMFGGCAQYDPVKPAEALAKLAATTVITFSECISDEYHKTTVQLMKIKSFIQPSQGN